MIDALTGKRSGEVLRGAGAIFGDDHIKGIGPGIKIRLRIAELLKTLMVDKGKTAGGVHFIDGFRQQRRQFAEAPLVFRGPAWCRLQPVARPALRQQINHAAGMITNRGQRKIDGIESSVGSGMGGSKRTYSPLPAWTMAD